MRASNRDRILDGVVRLIEREGVTAVTFDAVAAETGLTRGGLIYHFPSREALLLATHRYLAARLEAELTALAAGASAREDRYAAYVKVSLREATRAELALMLESVGDEKLGEIWSSVMDQWAPPVPGGDDPVDMARFLARMAADGIWAHEAIAGKRLPAAIKAKVGQALLDMLRPSPSDG